MYSVQSCAEKYISAIPPSLLQISQENRVRYLQCPAGVSVAQLKRLIRAKFGVGPAHPMALLTTTCDDPLHDSLTLVDVAYITSWQRVCCLVCFFGVILVNVVISLVVKTRRENNVHQASLFPFWISLFEFSYLAFLCFTSGQHHSYNSHILNVSLSSFPD